MANPDPSHTDDDTLVDPGRGGSPKMPRWVKVFGIVVAVLVLLVVTMMLLGRGGGGGHGPGRHISFGGASVQAPLSTVTTGTDLGGHALLRSDY